MHIISAYSIFDVLFSILTDDDGDGGNVGADACACAGAGAGGGGVAAAGGAGELSIIDISTAPIQI